MRIRSVPRSISLPLLSLALIGCASPGAGLVEEGVALVEAGDVEEGVRRLGEVLEFLPADEVELRARAHQWAGHGLTLLRDPEAAQVHYERGIELAPDVS